MGIDESFHELAKYGYVYRGDQVFYNVFDESEISEITKNCNDFFKDTLTLQKNVNIPLQLSLSYLPPTYIGVNSEISVSNDSYFVFAFNKGILTVYTTGFSLVEVGAINFRKKNECDAKQAYENKKYAGSIIQYELANAKARQAFSASNPLNIKKNKKITSKNGNVVNKIKPKKNLKIKVIMPNNVNYDEEDLAGSPML